MNLDYILPFTAPLISRLLKTKQALREAQFAAAPPVSGRVVFLGDSITEWTAWEDWFPDLRTTNRGIGGQAVRDVIRRLDTAIVEPRAISLLVGTNDLHGLGRSSEVPIIAEQMRDLVQRIRNRAPAATIIVNSVMPRSRHFCDRISQLNRLYAQIAAENDCTFLDLWPAFAQDDGTLRPELSADGLHLSIDGYKLWTELLRPHLAPFAER